MSDSGEMYAVHGGKLTDMRIERVLAAIYDGMWDDPDLDYLYTEVCKDFLKKDLPLLLVSVAGKAKNAQGLLYLSMFSFDYSLVHIGSNDWPGPFEFMPDATVAVTIVYPDDEDQTTDWTPGCDPSAAAIASIMQYCRERSIEIHNTDKSYTLN